MIHENASRAMSREGESIQGIKTSDALLHLDEIVRYAFLRLGSREEAEDVALETCSAAIESRRSFTSQPEIRLFLFGIARRKVANAWRRRRPIPIELSEVDEAIRDKFDESLNRIMVGEILTRISSREREVLILKYVVGFETAEVARLIGRREGAVSSLLQRARASFERQSGGAFDPHAGTKSNTNVGR